MSAMDSKISARDRQLPHGWQWVRLRDICYQDRHIIEPGSEETQNLPYLSLEDIESGTGRICTPSEALLTGEGLSTTFYFDQRHVLYGKLRPYLNKVALPAFAGRCTTELIPLVPNDCTTREFLALLLRRPQTVTAAMESKTGSRMPRADMDRLMELRIPLPPLAEQRRIARIVMDQLAAVHRARQAAEEQLRNIDTLPSAILRRAFSGGI